MGSATSDTATTQGTSEGTSQGATQEANPTLPAPPSPTTSSGLSVIHESPSPPAPMRSMIHEAPLQQQRVEMPRPAQPAAGLGISDDAGITAYARVDAEGRTRIVNLMRELPALPADAAPGRPRKKSRGRLGGLCGLCRRR